MNEEIKEILEKPNVYSFGDECYLYFGDYNKLKDYITNLQQENERLKEIQCTFLGTGCKKQLEDYKSRIDNALEFVNSEKFTNITINRRKVLNAILKR